MIHIDKETYKIDENNRYKITTNKSQIIIGLSLRKENFHINRLKHKEYGKSKRWNTFTISRKGEIFQHYDPHYYSDYIDIKQVDKKSISIVLENMGSLVKTDKYINWLNEPCLKSRVVEKRWLGQRYWEKINVRQFKSMVSLCSHLCGEFGIPKEVIEFHQYHKDTIKFKGVVLKSNYFEDSSSINPFIDLEKFKEMLGS